MARTQSAYTYAAVLSAVLISSLVGPAEARSCYYDRYGRYRCTGLLGGTVAGIIVAAVIPVIIILLLCCFLVKRRRQRASVNQAYTVQQQQQPPQMYQQPSGYYPPYGQAGAGGPGEYAQPQQPPYGQQGSYYGRDAGADQQNQQYAPPFGPPPSNTNADYTAPPAGSPPPAENQFAPPPGPPPQAHVASGNNAGKGESAAYYNR